MMDIKQLIPSEYCLKCLGCCRFSENPTIWAPSGCALAKDNGGYVCAHLNLKDNRCKIYAKRPLDCQLYPFLLVRKGNTLALGLHKSCCFIQDKNLAAGDILRFVDYFKKKLGNQQGISALSNNPRIAAGYQEEVEIIGDLQDIFIKAFIPRRNSLTLKTKPHLEHYLKKSNCSISAYSFANIFIWKDVFQIFWLKINESLCIFYQDAVGVFMALPPLGKVNEAAMKRCFEVMNFYNQNTEISRIENVPEDDLEKYKEAGFIAKLKDTEYICLREDLAALKGDSFKAKRAGYNYFLKHFQPEVAKYNQKMYKECLRLYQLWIEERKGRYADVVYQQMLEDSLLSFKTALAYYQKIGLLGYVVKVKGEIKACSLGYPLNQEVFCILFEACDLNLKGIAQFMFREFCRRLSGYTYINIMGASDLYNLKKVKLSYRPAKEIKAYTIYE